ncbi:MAG TPA: hypothetical protein VL689_09555 [Paraburkholderia sp.]|jgi:hypothetical protein|nr:hypothetical protein [Paraburkholderia sp.]
MINVSLCNETIRPLPGAESQEFPGDAAQQIRAAKMRVDADCVRFSRTDTSESKRSALHRMDREPGRRGRRRRLRRSIGEPPRAQTSTNESGGERAWRERRIDACVSRVERAAVQARFHPVIRSLPAAPCRSPVDPALSTVRSLINPVPEVTQCS